MTHCVDECHRAHQRNWPSIGRWCPRRRGAATVLIEAVVLSALGGWLDVVIASAASYGGAKLLSVALVFSAVIGMVLSYFPARRAAQMDPIEALRHE